MESERWQQIKSLLQSALEREPGERSAFLNGACAGDSSLRNEVESLIASHEQASRFIEEPAYGALAGILADDRTGSLAGHSLGPYQLIDSLGGGGMGEVYRARDTRLGREVAVKVLPSAFSADADRLRRFEQEARAASALNHPNILVIHDVGTEKGSSYLVTELLQGETLRQRLDTTTIAPRKAVDYALQIARGLAAAHDRGIIHRDLKPQNLFITKDGQVKILDFGLAKLIQPAGPLQTEVPTMLADADTGTGMVMGTAGYMSPEQVRGQAADQRSDIFSFGTVLYEMLTGQRAFQRASPVETMNAILKDEPAELSAANPNIPAGLERVVVHCLEKNPNERFQSTRDLVFDLESQAGWSSPGATSVATSRSQSKRRTIPLLIGVALLAAVAVAAYFLGRSAAEKPPPSFKRLTFRRGPIHSARFASDGQTIIYGAAWDGNPIQLFSTHPESPESRSLGLPDAEILSISSSGEMAISLGHHQVNPWIFIGTLARVPLAGAAPREVIEDVQWADWAPDGNSLAIVRDVGGRVRLEYPVGKVLYETLGWIGHPRISPKGDAIAFLDHPIQHGDGGSVAVVDLAGNKKAISIGWSSERGLAWSPSGDEIWFTATKAGSNRALYAVSLSGKERLITRGAGGLILNDISRDGRVLMTHDYERQGINCLPPGETKERDLAWLDYSVGVDLSDDGNKLLIVETGEGAGATEVSYLRKMDGSPAVRLGEGLARSLSHDGKWVIASVPRSSPVQLAQLPTGPGEPQRLTNDAINHRRWQWFPDGKQILFQGNEPGHGVRLYVQDKAMGTPRAITPEGVIITSQNAVSPDGKFVAAIDSDEKVVLYPVAGGAPQPVSGIESKQVPIRWAADGRSLYVYKREELPARVYRLDLSTGHKELWKELMPSDTAGVEFIPTILLTPDGKTYAYSYYRLLSDLYLVDGLK
jgi:serine/threonine protein kinase/Tol biopolymer transport system component